MLRFTRAVFHILHTVNLMRIFVGGDQPVNKGYNQNSGKKGHNGHHGTSLLTAAVLNKGRLGLN